MKNFGAILICFLLLSCNNDDNVNRNNPFLIDPLVNLQLDLSLPQYNPLNFPGNSVIINAQGIKGIVVYNIDNSQYVALDLTDPNHAPNDCSRMTIEGIEATCPCPDHNNKYNIITGQHMTQPNLYPMQRYRVVRSGNVINITN
jgi:nitrite reductase/ring-hydroxylating ferredoxin subunit